MGWNVLRHISSSCLYELRLQFICDLALRNTEDNAERSRETWTFSQWSKHKITGYDWTVLLEITCSVWSCVCFRTRFMAWNKPDEQMQKNSAFWRDDKATVNLKLTAEETLQKIICFIHGIFRKKPLMHQIYDFTAKSIGFVLQSCMRLLRNSTLNVAQMNTMLLLVPDQTPAGLQKLS